MTSQMNLLLDELQSCETKDEILTLAMKKVQAIIKRLKWTEKISELRIFLVDFSKASTTLRDSIYFDDSCKALTEQSMIIINADFLLELEAALRSFDLADSLLYTQYLRSDEHMFTLIELIRANPVGYLNKLRRLAQIQIRNEGTDIMTELVMLVLFFVSHELGHLFHHKDEKPFTSFLKADAKLEQKVANAVIKLCRHTDEFAKYGFDLPGFEKAIQKNSNIRQKEIDLRKQTDSWRTSYENTTVWFRDEVAADKTGTEILINYLKELEKQDEFTADLHQYLMVKALFVAALYSWYKDFHTFSEKISSYLLNSKTLMLEMMKHRKQYIKVASLFGETHRFTLLRSILAIESILKSRADLPVSKDEDTIWFKKSHSEQGLNDNLRKWWESECLQRYILLCIAIDTAVKMAYMGCSTGWILDIDKIRKSQQLFMMQFEPINAAVERLRRVKSLKFGEEVKK